MNTDSTQLVSKARARLLLDTKPSAAFLATLAMQLTLVATEEVETMQTNGTNLWFNPKFAASLTQPQLIGVVAHETFHCGLLHPFRVGNRDMEQANIACDHVVNLQLIEWGYELPKGAYCDPQFKGMSFEQVYAKLNNQPKMTPPQPKPGGKSGSEGGSSSGSDPKGKGNKEPSKSKNGSGKPEKGENGGSQSSPKPSILPGCPTGDFTAPDPAKKVEASGEPGDVPKQLTGEDWSIITEQAALAARAAGFMPGGMDGLVTASRKPTNDWQNELKQFITATVSSEQSWSKPNRRFIGSGLILPGVVKESIGEIVIFVDTSGSTQGEMLKSFVNELDNILSEVQPERVYVLYVDTAVRRVDTFERGDDFELHFTGGGGTIFQPAFDYVEQEGWNPLVGIYLTDLYCGDKPKEPDFPVIWAVPNYITQPEPFPGYRVSLDVV